MAQRIQVKMNKQETMEFINSHDPKSFDIEMALFDYRYNNFSGDMQDYSHIVIIRQSIVNGQYKQARQQAIDYNYGDIENLIAHVIWRQ